jgi:hypothetical protein
MKLDVHEEVSPKTLRQYGLGAQILVAGDLSKLILLTNSPKPKVVGSRPTGWRSSEPARYRSWADGIGRRNDLPRRSSTSR